jgi:hypothetical protein
MARHVLHFARPAAYLKEELTRHHPKLMAEIQGLFDLCAPKTEASVPLDGWL